MKPVKKHSMQWTDLLYVTQIVECDIQLTANKISSDFFLKQIPAKEWGLGGKYLFYFILPSFKKKKKDVILTHLSSFFPLNYSRKELTH